MLSANTLIHPYGALITKPVPPGFSCGAEVAELGDWPLTLSRVCSELNVSFLLASVPPLQFPIELADIASPELREWRGSVCWGGWGRLRGGTGA